MTKCNDIMAHQLFSGVYYYSCWAILLQEIIHLPAPLLPNYTLGTMPHGSNVVPIMQITVIVLAFHEHLHDTFSQAVHNESLSMTVQGSPYLWSRLDLSASIGDTVTYLLPADACKAFLQFMLGSHNLPT